MPPDPNEAGRAKCPRRTPGELQEELTKRSGKRVLLQLTDNRRRMVSVRCGGPGLCEVRLQRMFLDAPEDVVAAVADMAAGRSADRPVVAAFVSEALPGEMGSLQARLGRRQEKRFDVGMFHDIRAYARELNGTYLDGRSKAEIFWGRRGGGRIRRSIQFGSYDPIRNRITMNRRLDRPEIPRYFVECILFHEMLHEVLGIGTRADGRRDIHGRVFKLMESTFPDFDKALRFERELCGQLGML